MKILAVDDDEIALELLSAALSDAEFRNVVTVASGEKALGKIAAATQPFDCFLLDIQMPDMDGVELCSRIRAMPQHRDSPILMITAMSDRSYIDNAFAAGATDYVNKPFDPLEIGVRVRAAETLVREKRISTRNIFAVESLKAKIEEAFKFSLADPVQIVDVPRMISKLAMENYLLQLSRGSAFKSTAVAFAISDIEAIFARSTPTEMYDTLTDVAEAIADNLKHTDYFLAYCGYGEFVCVAKRGDPVICEELEHMIQWSIDAMELQYDSGAPCDVTLLMGEPILPSIWSAAHPLQMLDNALVSVAEKRQAARIVHSRKSLGALARQMLKTG